MSCSQQFDQLRWPCTLAPRAFPFSASFSLFWFQRLVDVIYGASQELFRDQCK